MLSLVKLATLCRNNKPLTEFLNVEYGLYVTTLIYMHGFWLDRCFTCLTFYSFHHSLGFETKLRT